MWPIYRKEINSFFSSLVGYIVIGVFLTALWLVMFVFPQFSLLESNYATLDQLFSIAPIMFLFLMSAITMRSFAEEHQAGTFELLATQPLRDIDIVLGKYLACMTLVVMTLIPTLLYYATIHVLGAPPGNLDSGAIAGSYIGLLFLAGAFVAIGLFASSLVSNQIVAFLLSVFIGFLLHWGFYYFSDLDIFRGKTDDLVQMVGMDYHYESISRGVLDTRDLIYFASVIAFFIVLTLVSLDRRKW